MPISTVMSEIGDRVRFGDPCYKVDWTNSLYHCDEKGSGSLASDVLMSLGIPHTGAPANQWTNLCPLDIENQDPMSVIRASLTAAMITGGFYVLATDAAGVVHFIDCFSPSTSKLPDILYCVPTYQYTQIPDLVIVKGGDPPPVRRCGPWINVFPGGGGGEGSDLRTRGTPFSTDPTSLEAWSFTWGDLKGFDSVGTSDTCDHGIFKQYGSIVFPDWERRQSFKDGINDYYELGGYETILFYAVDIQYSQSSSYIVSYNKSSEVPVHLGFSSAGTHLLSSKYFGPVCDIGWGGTGTTAETCVHLDSTTEDDEERCTSVQAAVKAGTSTKKIGTLYWDEAAQPSFYTYGMATATMSLLHTSRWAPEAIKCPGGVGDDSMYNATTAIMGMGNVLEGWKDWHQVSSAWLDLGYAKERRTLDIPQGSVWVEMPNDSITNKLAYALRTLAPHKGTSCPGWPTSNDWRNPYSSYMMQIIGCRFQGTSVGSQFASPCNNRTVACMGIPNVAQVSLYEPPGHLFSFTGDDLYTIDGFYAKITIDRPGLSIKGLGADASNLIQSTKIRVMPVYQLDLPAPVGAAGKDFNGIVNPYESMYDNMFCTAEDLTDSSQQRLQDACIGNTLELNIPNLLPDLSSQNTATSHAAFVQASEQCAAVARRVYDYFQKLDGESTPCVSFICGPPKDDGDIPLVGSQLDTPYGPRNVINVSIQYSDSSAYTMTVDTGPIQPSTATAGSFYFKKTSQVEVKGKVVGAAYGALYTVYVPGIGNIKAYNNQAYPYQVGDRVSLQLHNHPTEL